MLGRPIWKKIGGVVIVIVLIVNIGIAWYWSRMPDVLWVNENPSGENNIIGYATADTLIDFVKD